MSVESTRLPLLRGLIGVSAVIIIMAGARWGTQIVSPILMGLLMALLLAPIYGWLKRHMRSGFALTLTIVFLLVVFWLLFGLFAHSVESLQTGLATYTTELEANIKEVETSLKSTGINFGASSFDAQALMSVVTFVINGVVSVLAYLFPAVILCLFLLSEGELLFQRAQESLPNNPILVRLATLGRAVVRQFGVRGIVNAITGAGFTLLLLLLGVDYAVLWGVLTFFLSYIPYIGIVLAGAPAVILAFAEFGIERALLVVLSLAIVNVTAENLLAPYLMGRGLNISTTVTFIGFMFWLWLFGGPGAFLAMPLTILVILLLDSFPETRWLANIAMRLPDAASHTAAAEKPLAAPPSQTNSKIKGR